MIRYNTQKSRDRAERRSGKTTARQQRKARQARRRTARAASKG